MRNTLVLALLTFLGCGDISIPEDASSYQERVILQLPGEVDSSTQWDAAVCNASCRNRQCGINTCNTGICGMCERGDTCQFYQCVCLPGNPCFTNDDCCPGLYCSGKWEVCLPCFIPEWPCNEEGSCCGNYTCYFDPLGNGICS